MARRGAGDVFFTMVAPYPGDRGAGARAAGSSRQIMKAREPRRKVVVPARLNAGPKWVDAVILNVSSRGMLVRSDTPMAVGTYVDLRRGRQVIIGRAVWIDGNQFGVLAQDRIDIEALLGELSRPSSADGPRPERRADPQRASGMSASQRADRNWQLGALFQYVVMGAAVLAAAGYAAMIVHDLLSQSLGAVAAHL